MNFAGGFHASHGAFPPAPRALPWTGQRAGHPFELPSLKIDSLAPALTVRCMTLLQTRVDDGTARRFERAARERGVTPYSYLQALVKDAAAAPEPRTWASRRKWRDAQGMTPVPFGIVAQQREDSGER